MYIYIHLIAKSKEKEDKEILKESNEDEAHADQDPENQRADPV